MCASNQFNSRFGKEPYGDILLIGLVNLLGFVPHHNNQDSTLQAIDFFDTFLRSNECPCDLWHAATGPNNTDASSSVQNHTPFENLHRYHGILIQQDCLLMLERVHALLLPRVLPLGLFGQRPRPLERPKSALVPRVTLRR